MTEHWRVERVVQRQDILGEGPYWCAESRRLWWLDIFDAELCSYDPASGAITTLTLPHKVHAIARARFPWFVATAHGLGVAWLNVETGAMRAIHHPEAGRDTQLLNDGRVDADGRFWFASIHKKHEPEGALYRLNADGKVKRRHRGLGTGNGMVFSTDGRWLYLIDTYVGLLRFPRLRDGRAVGRPTLLLDAKLLPGWPDGMTQDSDGCLWMALAHGACVLRVTPEGRIDATLGIPARFASSCAFGDDDLGTLYITSATVGRPPAELAAFPDSGALFAIRTGHQGLPETPYAGQPPVTA